MKSMLYILSILLLLISCKSDDKAQPKILLGDQFPATIQIFKMQEQENGEFVKGKLNFSEKFLYNDEGKKVEHHILAEDGKLKAREVYVYQQDKLVGSNYLTASDSLLSYYVVLVDSVGNVTSKKSFDGSNKELLRIETFEYDQEKLMKKKSIFDDKGNPVRTFTFKHDEYGNELGYEVFEPSGILIFKEDFRITKKDDQNRWLEKTGFRDDKPLTVNYRTLWSKK